MVSLTALQETYRSRVRKYRKRAEEASTNALREYYKGRAEEAQGVVDALQKHTFSAEDFEGPS